MRAFFPGSFSFKYIFPIREQQQRLRSCGTSALRDICRAVCRQEGRLLCRLRLFIRLYIVQRAYPPFQKLHSICCYVSKKVSVVNAIIKRRNEYSDVEMLLTSFRVRERKNNQQHISVAGCQLSKFLLF